MTTPDDKAREIAHEVFRRSCHEFYEEHDRQGSEHCHACDLYTAAIEALVAEEREACAKVAEEAAQAYWDAFKETSHEFFATKQAAAEGINAAIRART